MTNKRPDYHSYLLRLWRTTDNDCSIWRASLEWPDTHRQQSFATLEALFTFLQAQTGRSSTSGASTKDVEIQRG
jgi:hypothetical protein